MSLKLGLQGASGRTGGLIISVLSEFPQFKLSAAIVGPGCDKIGSEAAPGVRFSTELTSNISNADVWIDFSTPQSSVDIAKKCAAAKKPLLIATTGQTSEQRKEIEKAALDIPILLARNTSLGVFALKEVSSVAKSILGDAFDIEIAEMHHRHKKDAPSGTALLLHDAVRTESDNLIYDRTKKHEARTDDEIGMSVIRGGDVAGEHTVFFIGNGERLELTHRAWDRRIFARGALKLVERLSTRDSGLYELDRKFFL